jgi:hypothetical protein
MLRRHVIQGSQLINGAATARPVPLLMLPRGFSGYVRVKFSSGTASDTMLGAWVQTNSENAPLTDVVPNANNTPILWKVDEEKTWTHVPGGFALLVMPGSGNSGTAYIDAIGEVADVEVS